MAFAAPSPVSRGRRTEPITGTKPTNNQTTKRQMKIAIYFITAAAFGFGGVLGFELGKQQGRAALQADYFDAETRPVTIPSPMLYQAEPATEAEPIQF
jgi:hypothetical protein